MTHRDEGEFKDWEGDHTDLFYTLSDAEKRGLVTIPKDSADGGSGKDAFATWLGKTRWLQARIAREKKRENANKQAEQKLGELLFFTLNMLFDGTLEDEDRDPDVLAKGLAAAAREQGLLRGVDEPRSAELVRQGIVNALRAKQLEKGFHEHRPQPADIRLADDQWFDAVDVAQQAEPASPDEMPR